MASDNPRQSINKDLHIVESKNIHVSAKRKTTKELTRNLYKNNLNDNVRNED